MLQNWQFTYHFSLARDAWSITTTTGGSRHWSWQCSCTYANSASNEEVKNIDIPASIGGGLEGTGEGATRRFLYCWPNIRLSCPRCSERPAFATAAAAFAVCGWSLVLGWGEETAATAQTAAKTATRSTPTRVPSRIFLPPLPPACPENEGCPWSNEEDCWRGTFWPSSQLAMLLLTAGKACKRTCYHETHI